MRALSVSLAALVAAAVLSMPGNASAAESVSSGELVERPDAWDGRAVRFEGEAIGEAQIRGDVAWLHINDDGYARLSIESGGERSGYNAGMPVVVPSAEAREVGLFGSHEAQGDIVVVTGTFRAADPDHGGEMLIEAGSLEVVEHGRPLADPVETWKLWVIAGLACSCVATALLLRRMRVYSPLRTR